MEGLVDKDKQEKAQKAAAQPAVVTSRAQKIKIDPEQRKATAALFLPNQDKGVTEDRVRQIFEEENKKVTEEVEAIYKLQTEGLKNFVAV